MSINKFICLQKQSLVLGISAALTIGFFTAYQIIFDPQNIYGLFAALGCFVATLHQVSIRDHNLKFKLYAGIVFAILIGLATALGSFYSSNLIISSFILLAFSFLIGYTAKSDLVFANGVLFIVDMYVIGTGFSYNISDSLIVSLLTFIGAIFFIFIFIFINRKIMIKDKNYNSQRSIRIIPDIESTLYAISLSLGLIIGNFISIYFNIEIGYWIPMTVLLIFKPDIIRSSTAIKHRLIGTLIGSLFAIPLAIFLFNPYIIWLVLFITTFLTICCFIKHYGSYVFFLTIFVAMLLKLAHMSGYNISISRLIYTIIGIIIVAGIIIASRYLKLIFSKN
ncbi:MULTISPECIES: FUSC family protein [unclassified Francisella]|uniref:FUSC family protein n=1 Tax=unclassified Francisella TaxID=2610885 RepID=UPI002E32562B|nr:MULTISPECIES: FUSC family protein [unclassified Francisella]MED7818852.1 FUSC family protein [Francisella sp. 19S2-4]MED7829693.1 FUSC family protein [Francisella sp. 19S2-10]